MRITVRVVDSDDDERTFSGIKVKVFAKERKKFWPQYEVYIEYTDDDGEAEFEIDDGLFAEEEGIPVEVQDTEYGPYDAEDDCHYTYTVPI